jgi:rubrerythrin
VTDTLTLKGASVWEQELYEHLTSHAGKERTLLEAYNEAATVSGSAAFKYLVGLIVEEEIRHHERFRDLADSLRNDAELSSADPVIPRLDWSGADSETIRHLTDDLIRQERADAKELRRLRRQLSDVRDTTLWVLLVGLMESDTEKHLDILKFIKDHATSK